MESAKKKHSLILDSRSRLAVTGAEDVNGFNEETVSVRTCDGTLVVKGNGLHIDRLNLETGEVSVDGKIHSLQYVGGDSRQSKLSRLFK